MNNKLGVVLGAIPLLTMNQELTPPAIDPALAQAIMAVASLVISAAVNWFTSWLKKKLNTNK